MALRTAKTTPPAIQYSSLSDDDASAAVVGAADVGTTVGEADGVVGETETGASEVGWMEVGWMEVGANELGGSDAVGVTVTGANVTGPVAIVGPTVVGA